MPTYQDIQEATQKKINERDEAELNNKMENNIIQLVLFDNEKKPFWSQGIVEKTVFLPNSTRKKSYVFFKNGEFKVTIGKVGGKKEYGVLKLRHRDVLFALLRLWAEDNWKTIENIFLNEEGDNYSVRTGYVKTTRHEILSHVLNNRPGKNDYEYLMDTLHELRTIPVEIYDIKDGDITKIHYLLKDYSFDKNDPFGEITIYFNEEMTKNYYRKKDVKLYYLETLRKFRSEIASILYPIIDRNLSQMQKYSIKIESLCEQTGLTKYKYNSYYKDKWNAALKELNNSELTCKLHYEVFFEENGQKELIFVAERNRK